MVVGVGVCDCRLGMRMCVGTDRHGFIDIESVVIDEWHHARHPAQPRRLPAAMREGAGWWERTSSGGIAPASL
jgi:hypothetical protein